MKASMGLWQYIYESIDWELVKFMALMFGLLGAATLVGLFVEDTTGNEMAGGVTLFCTFLLLFGSVCWKLKSIQDKQEIELLMKYGKRHQGENHD